MGKGDKRSRKGKIRLGSFGKSRPKPKNDPRKYKVAPKEQPAVEEKKEETAAEA